jgi:hypothetical protein
MLYKFRVDFVVMKNSGEQNILQRNFVAEAQCVNTENCFPLAESALCGFAARAHEISKNEVVN